MTEQTDYDRIVDRIRWRNLGKSPCDRESTFPEHLLCTEKSTDGHACPLWGTLFLGGRRFCRYHAPKGAVRR